MYVRERAETRWGSVWRTNSPISRSVENSSTENTQLPSNRWRHRITKGKESDRCDLCRLLQKVEGRFTTEDDLPIQMVGHIQHECETLSDIHTLTHNRCWRIIHTEVVHLTSSKWWFICFNGEKNLRTIWEELWFEFPEIFNLGEVQTLENTTMDQKRKRPMTETEEKRLKVGIPRETIAVERMWNKRPDGFTIKIPTTEQTG